LGQHSLAIDSGGTLHIAYTDGGEVIRYISGTTGSWSTSEELPQLNGIREPTIKVETDDTVHITLSDSSGTAVHARKVSGSSVWSYYNLTSIVDANAYVSFAIQEGSPYIIHTVSQDDFYQDVVHLPWTPAAVGGELEITVNDVTQTFERPSAFPVLTELETEVIAAFGSDVVTELSNGNQTLTIQDVTNDVVGSYYFEINSSPLPLWSVNDTITNVSLSPDETVTITFIDNVASPASYKVYVDKDISNWGSGDSVTNTTISPDDTQVMSTNAIFDVDSPTIERLKRIYFDDRTEDGAGGSAFSYIGHVYNSIKLPMITDILRNVYGVLPVEDGSVRTVGQELQFDLTYVPEWNNLAASSPTLLPVPENMIVTHSDGKYYISLSSTSDDPTAGAASSPATWLELGDVGTFESTRVTADVHFKDYRTVFHKGYGMKSQTATDIYPVALTDIEPRYNEFKGVKNPAFGDSTILYGGDSGESDWTQIKEGSTFTKGANIVSNGGNLTTPGLDLTTSPPSDPVSFKEEYSGTLIHKNHSMHDDTAMVVDMVFLGTPTFSNTTVDSTDTTGLYTSVKADSNGKAHIAYSDLTADDINYATNASGSWVIESIFSSGGTPTPIWNSLVLDSNNNAHISFYDSDADDLIYMNNTTSPWTQEIVDSTGNVGTHTSIDLDSNGNVHISYHDEDNDILKYATNISSPWTIETVDDISPGVVGQRTSIVVDSNDDVHISYYDVTNDDLKYATNSTGSWVVETVDTSSCKYTSILKDSADNIYIAYQSGADIKLANNISGWSTEVISTDGGGDTLGEWLNASIDINDKIHVVHQNSTASDLVYTTNLLGSWVDTVIAGDSPSFNIGQYSSIDVGPLGFIHIATYDGTGQDLEYYVSDNSIYTNVEVVYVKDGSDLGWDQTSSPPSLPDLDNSPNTGIYDGTRSVKLVIF
jgi:hypothetical protein